MQFNSKINWSTLALAIPQRWLSPLAWCGSLALADIQAAHRLVKVREKDWRLLCCRAHSDSPVVWVNCVGTFGVSSASYWWTRLFALVGRLVTSVLRQAPNLQIVYVPADFGLGA